MDNDPLDAVSLYCETTNHTKRPVINWEWFSCQIRSHRIKI